MTALCDCRGQWRGAKAPDPNVSTPRGAGSRLRARDFVIDDSDTYSVANPQIWIPTGTGLAPAKKKNHTTNAANVSPALTTSTASST